MTLLDSNITVGGFLAHSSLQHRVGRVQVDFGSQEKEASKWRQEQGLNIGSWRRSKAQKLVLGGREELPDIWEEGVEG